MSIIQFILIAFLVLAIIKLSSSHGTAAGMAYFRIFTIGLLCLGILAVTIPEISNVIANMIGVNRGADLALYSLIIVFIFDKLNSFYKINKINQRIDKLSRYIALNEVKNVEKNKE